jgi:hypothetical protein
MKRRASPFVTDQTDAFDTIAWILVGLAILAGLWGIGELANALVQ